MKIKILFMGLLGFLATLFSCNDTTNFKSVGVEEFESIIQDTAVIRLDVRTSEEYAEGHIANAVNIDITQVDFKEKALDKLSKRKLIAVYCRSGRRSKKAANELKKMGFKVVELDKGYASWTCSGKQIEITRTK